VLDRRHDKPDLPVTDAFRCISARTVINRDHPATSRLSRAGKLLLIAIR